MKQANFVKSHKHYIFLISVIMFFTGCEAIAADHRMQFVKEDETGKKITVNLRKELVYDLMLFNGKSFQVTFCPEAIDTIYMIAGSSNVFQYRKTNVYFWPITKEYMADWEPNVPDKSNYILEVLKGGQCYRKILPQKYVFEYSDGFQTEKCRLYTDAKAQEIYDRYFKKTEAYSRTVIAYYQAMTEYKFKMEKYMKQPGSYNYIPPNEPLAPGPLLESVTEPKEGFILNLAPGKYRIRFIDQNGVVVKYSERMLVAFPMISEGVGYQIIPEDKWTHATTSDDTTGNVFILPGQTIYLKPFRSIKFNKHHYLKLSKLQSPVSGRGMENMNLWVQVGEIPAQNLSLEISNNKNNLIKVEEKPFYVQQRADSVLGYDILDYDPDRFPDESSTFSAYKIRINQPGGNYRIGLVDGQGRVIKGSIRTVQPMTKFSLLTLVLLATLPLGCGFLVVGLRLAATRHHMKE